MQKISYRLCKDMVTVGRGVCFIPKVDWSNPNLKKNDHDHDNVDISVHWLKLGVFFLFPVSLVRAVSSVRSTASLMLILLPDAEVATKGKSDLVCLGWVWSDEFRSDKISKIYIYTSATISIATFLNIIISQCLRVQLN